MPTLDGTISVGPVTSRASGKKLIIEQDISYRVIKDSVGQDPVAVLTTTVGLPKANIDTNANGMMCKNVRLEPVDEHRLHLIATASFSSEVEENTDPATPQTGDPVEWIPQAEVEFEPMEEVARKDRDDKLYLNSAGDPFETGLILHRRIPTRVFTQFEPVGMPATAWAASTVYRRGQYVTSGGNYWQASAAGTSGTTPPSGTANFFDGGITWTYKSPPASGAVSIDTIEGRCDTINSEPFLGRATHTWLLEVRRATIGTYYGFRVWRIDYAIKYNRNTWKHKQYNMGWRYNTGSTPPKAYFEDNGVPYLGKLKLDGTPVADQLADDPSIAEFREFDQLDFNDFLRVV